MTVSVTGVQAQVSGIDAVSRIVLKLDPLLWSSTLCTVTTAIDFTLALAATLVIRRRLASRGLRLKQDAA